MRDVEDFSALKGRKFLLNQLMRPVFSGRVNHAQIFSGPRGTGRSSAAYLIAKAVNCTGAGARPCGGCPSCLRYIRGNPANLIIIEPEGRSIKIDRIRALTDEIYLKPESGMKCAIIKSAELMTEAAQNALLKTLEEPPEYALFMLICVNAAALLPTIRSRSILLRFAPLAESEVVSLLEERGVPADKARAAARAGGGSPGRALELADSAKYAEMNAALISAFEGLRTPGDVAARSGAFAAFRDEKNLLAEILEASACEMMLGTHAGYPVRSPLSLKLIENGIDGATLMRAIINCAEKWESNVAYQPAIEMLLFDITAGEDN